MIATTIEQSRHLLKLGLDTKTADMLYYPTAINEMGETMFTLDVKGEYIYQEHDDECIPAWSLSALLEVMCYCHNVDVEFRKDKNLGWICKFTFYDFDNKKRLDLSKCGETKIEAAFEIIVTLFVQRRIKKGGEE